jgi:hypothetical protein
VGPVDELPLSVDANFIQVLAMPSLCEFTAGASQLFTIYRVNYTVSAE